ncbi:MAG: aminopeptidase [Acutalibacteraceae bacterium]|nr:aminopeptidase [Clostridia bacterium]MEE1127342.1 aminopeptidase [Acutalibacteraceae bacterium]
MSEKSKGELLKEQLFYKNESGVKDEKVVAAAELFCEGYKSFLNLAKTERESADFAVAAAIEKGFKKFDRNAKYEPGDKVYLNNRGKAVILAVIGDQPVENGIRIAASHVDAPRLDLKPNPLYEDGEMALFKTHYYGGIKKYQWTTIPLALHGVVIRADGASIPVVIGEDEDEPCFVITDLLPHLAAEQSKRTLGEAIKGEDLNVLIGSYPFKEDEVSDAVKLNILNIIYEKYGIVEADFISAELELVPAFKSRDIGFDRSLIGAYGHDDRVCAYPALMAALNVTEIPEHTVITVLADKEEIGSMGNTGLESSFLKYFVCDLAKAQGGDGFTALANSQCLSADVNAAFDPNYPEVLDRRNAAMINHGAAFTKYTGARGKSGTSDASAEFVGKVRRIMDANNVKWQMAELGKVDLGGGGTVAMYLANLGMDVIDIGVPVLSMHAPFEVVAKYDVYMVYKAIEAFYKS